MLKFLRKYNKVILVVGGSLLMVVFLLPEALQQLGADASGRTLYRVDGKRITVGEAQEASIEYMILREVAPGALGSLGIDDRNDHWLLLRVEAARAGLLGGPLDGREYLTGELAEHIAEQITFQNILSQFPGMPREYLEMWRDSPEMRREVQQLVPLVREQLLQTRAHSAARTGRQERDVDLVLARLRAVERLYDSYIDAPRLSKRRVMAEAKHIFDEARIDAVFIPADFVLDEAPEPTERELREHYERFIDVPVGMGEYGIGYLFPRRVQLEWIELDRNGIAREVRPDPVEVRKRLLRAQESENPPEDLERERARIESQVRQEEIAKVMREAEDVIRAEIARETRRLESDGDYRRLPPDWPQRRPRFERIRDVVVERVEEHTGVRIPRPRVEIFAEDWLTAPEIRRLPGLGQSSLTRANQEFSAADLIMQVRELAGPNDFLIQTGIPFGPTEDRSGNRYFFTILDVRPESPPDSMENIRERVEREARRLRAFEMLAADGETFRRFALETDLESLAGVVADGIGGDEPDPGAYLRSGLTVTRLQVDPADRDLNFESFRDAVVTAASSLDPTVPADEIDAELRTVVVEVPRRLGVAVVRVNEYRPLTVERFRAIEQGVERRLREQLLAQIEGHPFSVASVARRLGIADEVRAEAERQ